MKRDKLKQLRTNKGLTQEEFARQLNITNSMYYKVESGVCNASAKFMRKLKSLYPEADIDDIFFSRQ